MFYFAQEDYFMKKSVTLLLAVLMTASLLAGCSRGGDKGAIIPIYLTKELQNFDPAITLYDAETIKVLGLVYEGLTRLDEDGKVQPALADRWYTKIDEDRGEYFLYFELDETRWNDDRLVQADDIVYAWKRILTPSASSPAACLLFNIKNARRVKAGEMTVDDLGLAAVSETTLEIEFEGPFDLDYFLMTVASPALVPLREDAVVKAPTEWAKNMENIVFNGPFTLKNWSYSTSLDIERNALYRLDSDARNVMKYVNPYKFTVDYTKTLKQQLELYEAGDLFYLGDLPAEQFDEYKKNVKTQDLLSTYTYYFNTNRAPFTDARVRLALSLALDRNEIADLVGKKQKPATGFVTNNVFDANNKGSFRKEGGDLISSSARTEEAKALLQEAGVKGGSFTITYSLDAADKAVAEYARDTWNALGFDVKIELKRGTAFAEIINSGEFDVVGIDYQGLAPDPFAFLAPFAKEYSGSVVNVELGSATFTPHITGYDNPQYDALIDMAFYAKSSAKRVQILHEAEALLLEDCPAIPLLFNVDIYLKSGKLSGIESSIFGYRIFDGVSLRGYKKTNEKYIAQEKEKAEQQTKEELEDIE